MLCNRGQKSNPQGCNFPNKMFVQFWNKFGAQWISECSYCSWLTFVCIGALWSCLANFLGAIVCRALARFRRMFFNFCWRNLFECATRNRYVLQFVSRRWASHSKPRVMPNSSLEMQKNTVKMCGDIDELLRLKVNDSWSQAKTFFSSQSSHLFPVCRGSPKISVV